MELVEQMKKVLANTFAFYYKAHASHWNVEGMLFASLHQFFGTLYTELQVAIDDIAEHIRALDSYPTPSLSKIVEGTTIEEDNNIVEAKEMIVRLVAANDMVRASLYDALSAANEINEAGIRNYLEGRIDVHDKYSWMLKAHLK